MKLLQIPFCNSFIFFQLTIRFFSWSKLLFKKLFFLSFLRTLVLSCDATDAHVLDFFECLLWVSKTGWIPCLHASFASVHGFLRFTSGATPADLHGGRAVILIHLFAHLYRHWSNIFQGQFCGLLKDEKKLWRVVRIKSSWKRQKHLSFAYSSISLWQRVSIAFHITSTMKAIIWVNEKDG